MHPSHNIHEPHMDDNYYYCRDERQKESLKRRIRQKRNSIKNLESQKNKLYDALERNNQIDVESSLKLSQKYQNMTDNAIRQVGVNYLHYCKSYNLCILITRILAEGRISERSCHHSTLDTHPFRFTRPHYSLLQHCSHFVLQPLCIYFYGKRCLNCDMV